VDCGFAVLALLACYGCGKGAEVDEGLGSADAAGNQTAGLGEEGNLTGIRFSEWYTDDRYGREVIDIFNFDPVVRRVNVTTLCLKRTTPASFHRQRGYGSSREQQVDMDSAVPGRNCFLYT
jgi:hypothetical protein